jgi:hypothetical protein
MDYTDTSQDSYAVFVYAAHYVKRLAVRWCPKSLGRK